MALYESKGDDAIAPAKCGSGSSIGDTKEEGADDAHEVFKRGNGAVDFRTVGWIHASVIFLKRWSSSPGLTMSQR
ncbi:hypothetical protein IMZ48_25875 [Candidatus Bathyarchaeota archaeon]|nr:hypothetical protein [Candidatus Bathyarchaeota archaeon]